MNSERLRHVPYYERTHGVGLNSRKVFSEVQKYLPNDLLSEVTFLLQDSGYVTIRPMKLARVDWYRLNQSIQRIGGLWVSNASFSHWSIPLIRFN
jgi:hypothetical protein